ncbi:hypothetical protein NLJ89_g4129 [Agrocybe chaxingu]|uniref:DRBM domain-containing protein n=1 Tax=Agrocybe chaxingu TaxID=84603 RepID=A0A9W8MY61_9AGAR|nr:hypothetical protein NLJ89_g4129 [Agrocybe chaxingu]
MSLPALPRIDGDIDLMLAVYTHKSLNMASHANNDWGDTDRLAELGAKVMDLVVTFHFFSQQPLMSTDEIRVKRETATSDVQIDNWLRQYGLKEKLRVAPTDVEILNDPKEIVKYFHTYVGASYFCHGLPAIQTWISGLIDPTANIALPNTPPKPEPADVTMSYYPPQQSNSPHMFNAFSPAQNYSPHSMTQSPPSMHASPSMGSFSSPPAPSGPPPPLPSSPPTMSSAYSLVTLALVNQTAAQKGIQVSYPAQQEGPPHQPTWTVKCCMNGQERGCGVGKSQKIAKEDAARKAWAAMGWGPT